MANQTHSLPENAFYNLKNATGWHGAMQRVGEDELRQNSGDDSLETFFGQLLTHPFARHEEYYVLTNRTEKDVTKHGVATYHNEHGASFSAMCFFPELEEVVFALPMSAFDHLPEHLWESTSNLPQRFERKPAIKPSTLVIYKDAYGLKTDNADPKPLFGKPVIYKTKTYINVNKLRQWLATREGKAFHQAQLDALLESKSPELYRSVKRGVSIETLIDEAKAVA